MKLCLINFFKTGMQFLFLVQKKDDQIKSQTRKIAQNTGHVNYSELGIDSELLDDMYR